MDYQHFSPVIAEIDCPRCGRPNSKVHNKFVFYEHGNPTCYGPDPEIVLTVLLRREDLDVRPDRNSNTLREDPEWQRTKNRTYNSGGVEQPW
jgi:hypothetical protein